jgi:amyloid beta precursor protein binding protein 1
MATTDKYDRQLRLWGAKGQRALADTTVVLLRASAAGTETLKNLVLPGVGTIVVVDDNSPCTSATSNFFCGSNENQEPRAQLALQQLQELNPDVQGEWKSVESLEEWTSLSFASKHVLVIAADLEPPLLRKVAVQCHERKLSLIVVQAYGLIGSVRLQTPVLPLLEPKPENEPPDLRLVRAFSGLEELAQSIDWDALDSVQHSHVPYPLILWKVALEWKQTHGGQLPRTFADKEDFRKTIQSMSRNWDNELNFQEASQNAYLAYTERELDMDHLELLKECSKDSSETMSALLCALDVFSKKHKRPPLHGTIPDMTASTNLYVQLQRIYHDQAVRDVGEMKQLVGGGVTISEEEVHTFCRNVFHLDLLRTRTLAEECSPVHDDDEVVEEWNAVLMDPYEVPEQTPFLWYIAMRACHVFYDTYGRHPGTMEPYREDVTPLQDCISEVVKNMKLDGNELVQQTLLARDQKYAQEMVRCANAELHCVASVLGGVASQEAVKIITGQYVPFNNTYVYNGIASTGGVYTC